MYNIRFVKKEDINRIVEIHIRAFPGFFLTSLGNDFLKKYYNYILEYEKSIFLIVEEDGLSVGFVAGFLDPRFFYSILKNQKLSLGISILKIFFKKPWIIFQILQRYKQLVKFQTQRENNSVELASLAVDPDYSGRGLGKLLIKKFLEVSKEKAATFVYLTTDTFNNEKVNNFYKNLGFKLYKMFSTPSGRIMNEYRYFFENIEDEERN